MSRRTPYILLAFANPQLVPEAYLSSLNREETIVSDHIQPFEFQGQCGMTTLSSATVEKVFNTVEKAEKYQDLILFHYGGHANGGGLLLNTTAGDSQEMNAEGLARLLGRIPSLQLVFLNGCSTKGQVQLLLKHGVKAIIATATPIQDGMAVDLADRFYQNLTDGETIRSAFDRARDFVLGKYKETVLSEGETRSLDLSDEPDDPQEELPWGLYVQEGEEGVLSWAMPQDTPPPPLRLGEFDKYTCDRSEQNSRFKSTWASKRGEKKVQHFFIHGEERQSPKGLFNRFVYKEIREGYERIFHKEVVMEEPFDVASAKLHLGTALFKAVELPSNRFKPAELTLENALKSPVLRDVQCVALKFKIYSSSWKDFTEEFLSWYLNEFSQQAEQLANSPEWLFFLTVVYEAEPKKGGFFGRFFGKSPKEKILKSVQNFSSQITALKELPPVVKIDVEKWLDVVTDEYSKKQQYLSEHFSDEKEWEMDKVEDRLGTIIKAYNAESMNISS